MPPGAGVHIATRVMALAGPDEVLANRGGTLANRVSGGGVARLAGHGPLESSEEVEDVAASQTR